jgi:hypothetical protein
MKAMTRIYYRVDFHEIAWIAKDFLGSRLPPAAVLAYVILNRK